MASFDRSTRCVVCICDYTHSPKPTSDPEKELGWLTTDDDALQCCCVGCKSTGTQSPKSGSDPAEELKALLPDDDEPDDLADLADMAYQKILAIDSYLKMLPSPQATDQRSPDINPNRPHISETGDCWDSLPNPAPQVVISTPTTQNKSGTSPGGLSEETLQRKTYGIDELLMLGEATNMEHMELRIHPGALAGKPLKVFTLSFVVNCCFRPQIVLKRCEKRRVL